MSSADSSSDSAPPRVKQSPWRFCMMCGSPMEDKVDVEGKTRRACTAASGYVLPSCFPRRRTPCLELTPCLSVPLTPIPRSDRTGLSRRCNWIFYDNPVPVVASVVEHYESREAAQDPSVVPHVVLVQGRGWPKQW